MPFVRVKNLSETPLLVAYNSQITKIGAGLEAIIEEEAAKVHFGDWDLRNDERRNWRTDEYKRLRGLAGHNKEGVSALVNDDVWEEHRPKVELLRADGSKIIGVLDDPTGELLPVENNIDRDRELRLLRDQLERLIEERDRELASQSVVDIPADSPDSNRRRPRNIQAEAAQ